MSNQMQGTGSVIGELDLGELGTLVVKDDGDHDNYVVIRDENGNPCELARLVMDMRADRGDDATVDAFDELASKLEGRTQSQSSTTTWRTGPFKCDECNKTNPSKWNATPDAAEDICKKCYQSS